MPATSCRTGTWTSRSGSSVAARNFSPCTATRGGSRRRARRSTPGIRTTYATLSADNEELHSGFEAAVTEAKTKLGGHYKTYIDGEWRDGAESFEARSPIDRDLLLGTFATATTADVDAAVAAARAAQPAWA